VAVASLGLAAPAFAHAELITTDPVDGAVLADPPTAITLTFGEGVETALGAIRLFDANGKAVAVGATGHPGGVAAKVQVSVPTLSQGTYLVSYRVISADSHPVQGSFVFSVGQRSAIQPDAAATLAGSSPSRALGVLPGISRFMVFAAFLLLAGSLAFTVLFTPHSPRMRTLVLVGAGGLAVGSLAALVLQGGYASGTGLAEALHPAVWRATARTAFGRQALVRVALAALGAALGLWIGRAAAWWWQMAGLLMGPALAVTLAWAGHAHTGRAIGLGLAADLVHLVALAWWLGGLVALTAVAQDPSGNKQTSAAVKVSVTRHGH
jgi:copper transport protein